MLGIGEFARLGQVSPRTLRHYGQLGILVPAHVDVTTGYRYYGVDQLAELQRVVALRNLGLRLDEIRALVADSVPDDQLRGLLRMRRVEIADSISQDQERLRQIEARLDAMEEGAVMEQLDVVVKRTDPLRVAATTAHAPGYGYDTISPVFQEQLPALADELGDQGLRVGVCLAWHEEAANDEVLVHLGWDIGDQAVTETDRVRVAELPVVEVASTIHHGSMVGVATMFESMARWIEATGPPPHRAVSRALLAPRPGRVAPDHRAATPGRTMTGTPSPIVVVSGPTAVGKSTVSRLVATALPTSAHLQGDDFLYAIVGGWVQPWLPEAAEQHEVVGAAMAVASMAFAEGGYTVVLDGHLFPAGVEGLAAACARRGIAVHYAVLRADLDTCLARANGRGEGWGRDTTSLADLQPLLADLHTRFADLGAFEAHVIDASGTPDQVAVAVLTALRSERLAVPVDPG